jgi:hypothetical protein
VTPNSLRPSLIACLLLALTVGGCGTPAEPTVGLALSAANTYESYDDAWALTYPLAWQVLPFEARPVGATFGAAGPEQEVLAVSVTTTDVPADVSTLIAEVSQREGDRVREAAAVSLGGRPAARLVLDAQEPDRPARQLRYLLPIGTRVYDLTLRSAPEAFAAKQEAFEAIVASFKLL